MKPSRTKRDLPVRLEAAKRRFDRWRQTPDRSRRIPEALWSAAAKLANEYGVCKTAQALGLDYNALKQRVTTPAQDGPPVPSGGPTFMEFIPASASTLESVIEVEEPGGSRLRIHLKGAQVPDIAALVQQFAGGRPR